MRSIAVIAVMLPFEAGAGLKPMRSVSQCDAQARSQARGRLQAGESVQEPAMFGASSTFGMPV